MVLSSDQNHHLNNMADPSLKDGFPLPVGRRTFLTRRTCTRFVQVATLPKVPWTTILIISKIIRLVIFYKVPFWILLLLIPTLPQLGGVNLQ